MKATVFPGKYLIVTGLPAIDLQLSKLLFNTHDEAKAGAVELELFAKGIKYTVEHVDVIISSPAGNIPKTVEGYWITKNPNGDILPYSISDTEPDSYKRAYLFTDEVEPVDDEEAIDTMMRLGYKAIPVSINIPKQ